MFKRTVTFGTLVAVLIEVLAGCKKAEPPAPPPYAPATIIVSEVAARVHWLGKDRLASETNAAALMRIWQMPESVRLETETIEKLARAPWRYLYGDAGATNANSALLQSLLEDVVKAESYLEIRQPTNQPPELVFAIRVNGQHARLWETNLGVVIESLSGNKTAPTASGGWQIEPKILSTSSRHSILTVSRSGDWTILGLSGESNILAADFVSRIQRDEAPFKRGGTNFWFEADVELGRLTALLSYTSGITQGITKVSGTVTGDGENVRTRADLFLANSLAPSLDSWAIPTNLIQSPLISLTAVRRVAPLLKRLKLFSNLTPEATPDQLYEWDLNGPPLKMFFALRLKDASGSLNAIAAQLMNNINPRVSPQRFGAIAFDTNACKLIWAGLPFAAPFVQAVTNSGQQYLFGGFGLYSFARTNPLSPELLAHVFEGTNLVYFDWEHTGEKITHWRYFDDASRIIFDNAHLARFRDDSASIRWIGALSTNLSHSVTEVKEYGTNRLTFARKSTVGLTALEIDFLANWLDLSQFPLGLETILRTNSTPRPPRQRSAPPSGAAAK